MPRQLQPCGTPAAFAQHRLRGETPCPECRSAYNAYSRDYYATSGLRERLAARRRAAAEARWRS